jgi:hypothetical protein
MAQFPLGSRKVVDQGVTTLSWAGGVTCTIPLTRAVDLTRHMAFILSSSGQIMAASAALHWQLQASQILLTTWGGGNGRDSPCSWMVCKVPSGLVQRGLTTLNANGTLQDIALATPIDLATAEISLCHVSGAGFTYSGSWVAGYLKKHATDTSKLQAFLSNVGGTGPVSWEAWKQ